MERRLAAVLAADVAGYSRLMGRDKGRTLSQLKALRKALVDPAIAAHRGRIVKTSGDGLLVEFASAVDAARCAVELQQAMGSENAAVPSELRIEFRIGIHVGDIIIDEDDIFGDGVNIAARLEGIAAPGGLCISDDAHRQVRGKLEVAFEDMGLQTLKNISEPMRSWRWQFGDQGGAIQPGSSPPPTEELPLPDKPSIVVLPFDNMSAEPGQDYLADGIVEAITSAATTIRCGRCRMSGRLKRKKAARLSNSLKLPSRSIPNTRWPYRLLVGVTPSARFTTGPTISRRANARRKRSPNEQPR